MLSYFWEWPVETISSEQHEMLQVLLIQGQYQLVSPNAIYSYGELYTNFLEAFRQLDAGAWPRQKVLVLGLGLAPAGPAAAQGLAQIERLAMERAQSDDLLVSRVAQTAISVRPLRTTQS